MKVMLNKGFSLSSLSYVSNQKLLEVDTLFPPNFILKCFTQNQFRANQMAQNTHRTKATLTNSYDFNKRNTTFWTLYELLTIAAFICSKSLMETSEQCVKSVQS